MVFVYVLFFKKNCEGNVHSAFGQVFYFRYYYIINKQYNIQIMLYRYWWKLFI